MVVITKIQPLLDKFQRVGWLLMTMFQLHFAFPKTSPGPLVNSSLPVLWRNTAQPPTCRWAQCTLSLCEGTGYPGRCSECLVQTPSFLPVVAGPDLDCPSLFVTLRPNVFDPLSRSHPGHHRIIKSKYSLRLEKIVL